MIGLLIFVVSVIEQVNGQAVFAYPLRIKPKLNANFGEMRPNHFHMGLDLSTMSRENLPVYAPSNGFISRIKIETGGFGRAIYIDHPNGTTTLYAHMNKFIPAAETYLKEQQYVQQSWKIDLKVPPDLIPVKRGQLIGYSGNTGASQGPHVHYEIRDTKTENCLNPLLLNFPLTDHTPPELFRIAFYDRNRSIYEQTPIVVGLIKRGGKYVFDKTLELPFDKVFIAIQAIDRVTGFPNPNGIFSASLMQDGIELSSFKMENISYDQTRYLNGHIDFKTKMKGGPYYQMLFPPKEFGLDIYTVNEDKRFFELGKQPSSFVLNVADANGNISVAEFKANSKRVTQTIAQKREGVLITAGDLNILDDPQIQFVFHEDAFYDDVYLKVQPFYKNSKYELSSVFQTLPEHIPVHSRFTVRIKPNRIEGLIDTAKVLMKRTYKTTTEVKKARDEKGFFAAEFRDLGFFQLIEDVEPPVISTSFASGTIISTGSRMVVNVMDNNKIIDQFTAKVDGKWLMFRPSGNSYVYIVDEHFPVGEHKLSVVVKDLAGNSIIKEWGINRR